MDLLGERGYDHTYGARPLRRIIQNLIEDPLAEGVLDSRFQRVDGPRRRRGRSAQARAGEGAERASSRGCRSPGRPPSHGLGRPRGRPIRQSRRNPQRR